MLRQDYNAVVLAEYGNDWRIAALPAIGKEDDAFRIISDGTHCVKACARIVRRDPIRFGGVP